MVTILNQDTNEFLVQYNRGFCHGVAPSKVPESIAPVIGQALASDPFLLNRYQLDLVFSSGDDVTRAQKIIGAIAYENQHASDLLQELQATGLIWYLPSIKAPLTSYFSSPSDLSGPLDRGSPLQATTAPLLRSSSGIDLARDLAYLQKLQLALPYADPPRRAQISDATILKLRTAENQLIANAHQAVDEKVQPIIDAINQQQSSWSFGFEIGIGATIVPGFSFTYGNLGLRVDLNVPAVALTPILPGITLPAFSFGTPNPSAPGGGTPEFSIPAGAFGPGSSSSQRSPAGSSSPLLQADPPDPTNVTWTLPEVQWDSMLSLNNSIGRAWLNREIQIATPLLTRDQLDAIAVGLQQPEFPPDLASTVLQKALEVWQSSRPDPATSPVEAACTNEVLSSCGMEVAKALNDTTDPKRAIELAAQWGAAFNRKYDALRQKGHLERAVSEAERIEEVLNDNFNPVNVAIDQTREDLAERYFPRLAPIVKWAGSWEAAALTAFLQPQDTATEVDDMTVMDYAIQERVADIIRPFLKPDWQDRIKELVEQSKPGWRIP
jgi:hypothetical protein